MTNTVEQDEVTAAKLMRDLETIVADAEALLKATAGQTGDRIREARARAEQSLAAARERLGSLDDEALQRARELVDEGEEYVRRNPWTAVGVAAGVGLIVGLLLGRR